MLEGIMMKNKSQYSVAVRRPDGEIEVKTDEYVGIAGDKAWAKLPLIRGMVNFIDSMILGMKTLSWSASFYEDEEEEAKPGKFEKFLLKLFGEKAEKVVMGATVAFSVIMAVLIPVLSGLSQYLSVKLSQQTTAVTNNPQADQMASTMKTMNVTLPLVSVFMCFTLPTGLGIYWVASAVVRMVQQFFINKHLNKIPMDELIKENMENAAKKRKNKNEVDASNVNKMAHKNVKNIHEPVRTAAQTKELEEKLEEAKKKNENAKAGSLADKANLVKRFNEGQK